MSPALEPERRAPDARRLPGFDAERLLAVGLTRRELAVLDLVARGRRNEEIATTLRISPLTVKKHLELMYERLGATNKASLVALAWHASQVGRVVPGETRKSRRSPASRRQK